MDYSRLTGPIGPIGATGPTAGPNNATFDNLTVTGKLKVNGVDFTERLKIFNQIPEKLFALEDLKIMLNAWDNANGGFNEKIFLITRKDDEWKLLDLQCWQAASGGKTIQRMNSQYIQVCLEYLFLIFKFSKDIVDFEDWFQDAHFGLLIQVLPNSEPFAIYEFEKKNLDEKDFINRVMMFIKERYPQDEIEDIPALI